MFPATIVLPILTMPPKTFEMPPLPLLLFDVLLAMVLFVNDTVLLLPREMPPPIPFAVLLEMVLLMTVKVKPPGAGLASMPPPLLLEVLPLMVLFSMRILLLSICWMPPPIPWVLLSLIVLLTRFRAPLILEIPPPPPLPFAVLLEMVLLLRFRVLPAPMRIPPPPCSLVSAKTLPWVMVMASRFTVVPLPEISTTRDSLMPLRVVLLAPSPVKVKSLFMTIPP